MASLFDGVDLSTIPAGIPPVGVTPNFVNPETREELPKIFIYVTLPPMVVFLSLRIYARIKYSLLGLDDYLCVLAAIAIVAHDALCFAMAGNPAGPHMWNVPLSKITVEYAQFSATLAIMYLVAALLLKVSILVLYRRIFRPSEAANLLIWTGTVVVVVFYIIVIILFSYACVPHADDYGTGGWLSPIYIQRCYSLDGRATIASGAIGTVTDLYILVIPAIFLMRLRTSNKIKAGLLAIFAVGTAALAFSAAGTYYRSKIVSPEEQDLTWNAMPIYATNVGEINIGIMSSCMPVIFVVFRGFTIWSASWATKIWSLISRGRTQDGLSQASDIQLVRYNEMSGSHLPEVPKGSLTGLKSFMRNFHRTNPVKTQTTTVPLTYASMDYDYHAQLKQQHADARSPPLSGR